MRNRQPSRAQWLRRLASRRRDKIAFVFSGGGPLGALQVGAVKAMLEAGLKPDIVVGTSVGALNGTFIAFEPSIEGARRLEDVWRGLQEGDLFPGGRFRGSWAKMLVRGDRVFENAGIRRLIDTRLGNAHFEDAQIPLGVVTTDLETGTERVFTTGEIMRPLLASAAMPGIFPPVEIEGRRYTDGGVSDNVPIQPAIQMGARTIYVMNATATSHQRRPLQRPMDYLLHAFALARSQRLMFERKFIASQHVRLIMVPTEPLDFFVPFASVAHTPMLIDSAYDTTKRFLEGTLESTVTTDAEGEITEIRPAR
jgi:NTE family protein